MSLPSSKRCLLPLAGLGAFLRDPIAPCAEAVDRSETISTLESRGAQ